MTMTDISTGKRVGQQLNANRIAFTAITRFADGETEMLVSMGDGFIRGHNWPRQGIVLGSRIPRKLQISTVGLRMWVSLNSGFRDGRMNNRPPMTESAASGQCELNCIVVNGLIESCPHLNEKKRSDYCICLYPSSPAPLEGAVPSSFVWSVLLLLLPHIAHFAFFHEIHFEFPLLHRMTRLPSSAQAAQSSSFREGCRIPSRVTVVAHDS